jgi:uncharacterized protein YciI
MAFLIAYKLLPDATEELRLSLREDHIAFTKKHLDDGLVVQVSRLFSEDGSELAGGYVLLDTDKPAQARAFYEADPYTAGRVWASVVFGRVDLPAQPAPTAVH